MLDKRAGWKVGRQTGRRSSSDVQKILSLLNIQFSTLFRQGTALFQLV